MTPENNNPENTNIEDLMAIFNAESARADTNPGAAPAPRHEAPALQPDAIEPLPLTPSPSTERGNPEAAALSAAPEETETVGAALAAAPDAPTPIPATNFESSSPLSVRRRGDGGEVRPIRLAWDILSWGAVTVAALAMIAIIALILVPRAMGWEGMVVLSGSMEPELKTGGLAFVQPLDEDDMASIKPGDVITFRNPRYDTLVSHRVVEVMQDEAGYAFVTKGDANADADAAPVRAGRVVGKVRFDVPELGNVVRRLQDRSTYYIVLGIPAALLIAGEVWNISRELRRNGRALPKGTSREVVS